MYFTVCYCFCSIEDSEPAIKGKHPHSFKMVTDDVNDRVYYFSFVSIHVLQVLMYMVINTHTQHTHAQACNINILYRIQA